MGASQIFSLQPFKENGRPEYVRPTAFRRRSGRYPVLFKRARNGRLRAGEPASRGAGRLKSLFSVLNPLFFKRFSLLICVGNFVKSRCSTAVSCYEIVQGASKMQNSL
jgi:hypothetical protein